MLYLPERGVDQRVHHPAHHRLGLAIGRPADVFEDDAPEGLLLEQLVEPLLGIAGRA